MITFFSRSLGDGARTRLGVVVAVLLCGFAFGALDGAWTAPKGAVQGWLGLRLAGLVTILIFTVAGALILGQAWIDAAMKRWWDPAEAPDGNLGWNQLIELVHRYNDPLVYQPGLRVRAALAGLIALVAGMLVLAGVAETLAAFAWHPVFPDALLRPPSERIAADALANLSGNLTALLALLAASVSIWFTSSQLRAKVLADNRQEWLGRTRTLMGRVVSLAAERASAAPARRKMLMSRLDPLRLELELRLNPSEKDHRLLMYLLRRLTFIDDLTHADSADEGVLVCEIKGACSRMAAEHPARFGSDPYEMNWRPVLESKDRAALVTYCMRLSHIVLKREWERVKATR